MANTTVGKIVYDAVINTDGLKKDAQVADKQAQAVGDSLGNKVAKGATIAGTAMVAVGATFMKVTADSLKATVEWAGGVAKLSRETGSGTEAISKLLYAGKRYGLSTDDMSKSLGIFSKKLVEANKGNNETADTFNKMGVSIKGADGKLKPFDSIFGQVAEKFKAMPNGVEKTALAMQLFGKSGKDMLPLLNQGADGVAKLGAQAEKFGFVLTQNNIKAFAGFRKATFESEQAAKGLQIQLGLLTLGPMTQLKQKSTELVSKLNELPAPMKDTIGAMIVFGGPALSMAGSLLAAAGSVGMLVTAFPALLGALGPIGWAILAIVAAVGIGIAIWKNWGTIVKALGPILKPLQKIFSDMWVDIQKIGQQISKELAPAFEFMKRNSETLKKVLVVLLAVALFPFIAGIAVFVASLKIWSLTIGFIADHFQALKKAIGVALAFAFPLIGIGILLFKNWGTIVSFFGDIIATVFKKIQGFWTGTLYPVFEAIKNVVTTIANVYIKFWAAILLVTIAVWSMIAQAVWKTVQGIWNVITTVFVAIWQTISVVTRTIWGVISGAFNLYLTVVTTIMKTIWGVISGAWSGIWGFIHPILGAIGSAISNAFRNALNIVSSLMSSIWNAVSSRISAVVGIFRGLGSSITSSIGNFGSLLYNKGKDLIQGLLNGMGSLLGSIGSFMASKLPSALQGPFKRALGINSPSKVFAEYGKNITQGLANGVTNNLGLVSGSMGALSATANISANPSLNAVDGPSVGQARSSNVTVNVDMSGIMARSKADEREIAKSLIARVNEELRSKGKPVIGGGAI